MKSTFIFDLDHTLIDSSHRQLTLADGSLDLANWIDNCTREKIFADTIITPMFEQFCALKRLQKMVGISVIACTARVMSDHDHDYLLKNGLHFDAVLSRPIGCKDSDHLLKERLLRNHAFFNGFKFEKFARISTMVDDNLKVLSHLRTLGFHTINATTNKVEL
jgi:FMN phosphatase YigB (HAD superfamily)